MAFDRLRDDLAGLAKADRLRSLVQRTGADFSSNDYLGLAGSDLLREAAQAALDRGVPVGSGGSRLLRGNCDEHELLEVEAARFFGREAALFFPTGYTANGALFATLPQSGDLIVHDALIHASVHEGLRLTRADVRSAQHNDPESFNDTVTQWRAGGGTGTVWIAIESLYSMDGDFAPLAEMQTMAARHDAILVVDEAHATGVFGKGGRGVTDALPDTGNCITLHTFGKAMGCEGAVLCGPAIMRDHMVNRGRGFIFSTAPSPLTAAIARASLRIIEQAENRRAALSNRIARARILLQPLGADCHGSPIIPLVLGEDARTMQVAATMRDAGLDVRGIRPPSVPDGTSRLRIVMSLNASEDDLDSFAGLLQDLLK